MLEYKIYIEKDDQIRLLPYVKIKWPDSRLLDVDVQATQGAEEDVLQLRFEPKCDVPRDTQRRYAAAIIARALSVWIIEYALRRTVKHYVLLAGGGKMECQGLHGRLFNMTLSALQPMNQAYVGVAKRLYEFFLEGNSALSVRGFVRFRLKDLTQEICKACEQTLRVLEAEKEYHEFIRLLRRFVEMQTPQTRLVHIKVGTEGGCSLLDEHMQPIMLCSPGIAVEMVRHELTGEDMIISSLITLAPQQIKVHHAERAHNKRMLDTISRVFYGRVCFANDHILD